MHENEISIRPETVRHLIESQYSEYADLPLTYVPSSGTVNAIWRLGDDLCVRLPRVAAWSADILREWRWIPHLARHLPLRVPEPLALGSPDDLYPFDWAVYRWIPGESCAKAALHDEAESARILANFVNTLHAVPVPDDAPPAGRRPLRQLDALTYDAIMQAGTSIDEPKALAAWVQCREAPVWDGRRSWIHADLLPMNLLVEGGRIAAVIDFGSAGAGDPAFDLIPAWTVFGPEGRAAYREAAKADPGDWERARGYALHQAALIIPYYRHTFPAFAEMARKTVAQVLLDFESWR